MNRLITQDYKLLEPSILPGSPPTADFVTYVSNIFVSVLLVCATLAVLMIVIGGLQYILSPVPGQKESGKKKIQGALIGLIIALSAYLILNTINPCLVNLGAFLKTTAGETPASCGVT